MRVERNRKTFRKQFARVTFRLLASTALALIVVAGARPAAAQDAGSFAPGAFVGGQQVIPQYECHESPGNFACGTVGGDTIIYDLTGSFTAQSSWDSVLDKGHFVRAPGPDDAAIIDGHHSGYFQPVMGPEMTGAHNTKISGYYTIGFNGTAGFSGDGFHVSNVSGTVKSLSLTGFGTAEIGTITATDVAFLGTNGGFPVAKILADGSIDYAAGFESQGLTITGGGMLKTHQLDISASTAKGYTGAIDIKDGTILYGDAVRILSAAPLGLAALPDPTTVSAPVTISGGAIKAGGTLSLLVSDAVNSPTVTVASSVILDSGGLYATGEAGHGDIIVGTTIDGNTANPGQRFIVKADGASNINSAGDTLIGLYAPATLEARGTTKIVTSGDAYIGVLEPASDSSVLLSGAGVKWNAAKRFLIGGNGAGNVLTLENGAALNVDDRLFLGVNSGGRGNVVLNSGSLITAHAQAGPGTIAVSIGDGADAFGDIAIKGKGSKLTAFGTLIVGRSGMGGLSVSDGGAVQVNDPIIRVGRNAGSEGTVRITGEGSELTSANGTLYAGFRGTGNVFVSVHGLLQIKAIDLGSMTRPGQNGV